MRRSLLALNALNFFMADVQAGLGPFLGVFLQARHWSPAEIGVSGDRGRVGDCNYDCFDRHSAAPDFFVVSAAQVMTGVAGAAVAPAVAAITLGLVRQRGFPHQLGRNEACNHSGKVVVAALAGATGYWFGLGAVFVVLSITAVFSIAAALRIDPRQIDHRAARGAAEHDGERVAGFAVLLQSMPLVVLGVTLTLFHLGNAAMLPLFGQAVVAQGAGFTGATIVIAQATMVPVALMAARLAETRGYWIVFLLALIALPVRGVTASLAIGAWGWWPVQILDGFGAGILGVAVPGLVARILSGTGRVNAGLGAVRGGRRAQSVDRRHRGAAVRLSRGLSGARRNCRGGADLVAGGAAGDGGTLREPFERE
jgi:hypothetical protein